MGGDHLGRGAGGQGRLDPAAAQGVAGDAAHRPAGGPYPGPPDLEDGVGLLGGGRLGGRRSLLGWEAKHRLMPLAPRGGGKHPRNRHAAAQAVVEAAVRHQPDPSAPAPAPAWWRALDAPQLNALVGAAPPPAADPHQR
ncbi:hypothetical protein [Streptomyces chrestomyceticus]|uniref:hypothetical protein n=1 Tax=Streptomyces chrestomyceticus TaxID=68185 RepID=UPI0035A8EEC2